MSPSSHQPEPLLAEISPIVGYWLTNVWRLACSFLFCLSPSTTNTNVRMHLIGLWYSDLRLISLLRWLMSTVKLLSNLHSFFSIVTSSRYEVLMRSLDNRGFYIVTWSQATFWYSFGTQTILHLLQLIGLIQTDILAVRKRRSHREAVWFWRRKKVSLPKWGENETNTAMDLFLRGAQQMTSIVGTVPYVCIRYKTKIIAELLTLVLDGSRSAPINNLYTSDWRL